MFRSKALSLLAVAGILALAACSDITGPSDNGFCPVTGGPGTCPGVTLK